MGKIVLGYWEAHGLGGQIRFLLEIAGAEYEDLMYKMSNAQEWFSKKESLGLTFPNLPYLMVDDDVKLSEHSAIMRYLGRKYKLAPTTEQEMIMGDQTESFVLDLRNKFYRVAYDNKTYETTRSEFIELANKKLQYLDHLLAKNEYVVGNRMTYIDVMLFDFLLMLNKFEPTLVNKQKNLVNFVEKMEKLPKLSKFLESYRQKKLTFCGPMATWNSTL